MRTNRQTESEKKKRKKSVTYKRQLLFIVRARIRTKNILQLMLLLFWFQFLPTPNLSHQVLHHESFCDFVVVVVVVVGIVGGTVLAFGLFYTWFMSHASTRSSTSTFDFLVAVIFAQNATFCARDRNLFKTRSCSSASQRVMWARIWGVSHLSRCQNSHRQRNEWPAIRRTIASEQLAREKKK